ncbi:MAG TPA: HNH endonuclease signature motif containing protein, partial [Actinomycetota bacterium]|nr:HNH endonuclease signature motif containing protein [Actinomycetota bacterium]
GEISFDQASEIARTEESRPGSARELIDVAKDEAFHVLRDKSRRIRLEAEQRRDLGARQHDARSARNELGMIDIHLRLESHVGVPIVNRAEAEASRLHRQARRDGRPEPYERHLADAFGKMLAGSSVKGRAHRPELVVLVSHEVAKRGWKDVREGEVCKVPGIGPVSPRVAKSIAQDAFLTGVLYDGVDLRNIQRWTRNIPVEVRLALELGKPPEFDGIRCAVCGNRFRTENDHVEPHVGGNPASLDNLDPLCWACHQEKTEADREAGKLQKKKRGPPLP